MFVTHSLLHITVAETIFTTVLACPETASLPSTQARTDWVQGPVFTNVTYANNSLGIRNMLDVYATAASWEAGAPSAPCVVFIHGGGWRSFSKSVPNFVKQLRAFGITTVGIGYRLSQEAEYPAQIIDVENAIIFLKQNAATYRIDPTRIIAMGSSAGGHLACLLSTRNDPSSSARVLGLVDFYGPVILNSPKPSEQITELLGCTTPGEEGTDCYTTATEASPWTHIASDNPPTIILQGKKDKTTPWQMSQAFRDELSNKGVDAIIILDDDAGHNKEEILSGTTLGTSNNIWLNKWIIGTFISCGSPYSYSPLSALIDYSTISSTPSSHNLCFEIYILLLVIALIMPSSE